MLPIELWESIIDDLHDDRPSLAACALVRKAWLPKSRQHLFNHHFLKLGANNTEAFCDLVHDLKSTLKYHITAVELNGYSFLQRGHQDVDSLFRLSQAVIHECSNLKSLRLYNTEKAFPLLTRSNLTSNLTGLHLSDSFGGWGDRVSVQAGKLLDFVGNFTALESLSMWYDTPGIFCGPDPIQPIDTEGGTKKTTLRFLRALDLDLIWNAFIPWFLVPGVLNSPGVEKLEITISYLPNSERHVPMLQEYLDLFAASLKDLILSLDWDHVPVLNLSQFKALRCVVFKVGSFGEPEEETHFQELCDIIMSTRKGGDAGPLAVIVTNEEVDPPYIKGVTWILDEWYRHNPYEWNMHS
ncbi:hypothetical protein V5O48_005683 [Marasmius crinis-equi]|uniref:F-box domain-containing protein n=1 Tax=Marasmius crinis-equi TaxID=585013 RepID=A0ABR3FLV8_9AGAR